MKLCIDDANLEKIKRIYEYYPIDGVSTNPTILSKYGRNPYELLKDIRDVIGEDKELFVQVTGETADIMVEEAHRIIQELGSSTLVKVPCVPEGFKAMKELKNEQIRFIGTAVYTPMQGYIAAKAGAEYIAPYVNRIDNLGFDGVQASKDIHDIIQKAGFTYSGLLAASFKNVYQVLELAKYGVKAVTVSPDIIEAFAGSHEITSAVAQFSHDFASLVGENKTMADC